MMQLGFKLSRRSIAVAAVGDWEVAFEDFRFLPAKREQVAVSATAYFQHLFAQLHPSAIAFYAPAERGRSTREVLAILEDLARTAELPVQRFTKPDVLSAMSVVPVATRADLHDRALPLRRPHASPTPPRDTAREVTVSEAVVVALLGAVWSHLPPP